MRLKERENSYKLNPAVNGVLSMAIKTKGYFYQMERRRDVPTQVRLGRPIYYEWTKGRIYVWPIPDKAYYAEILYTEVKKL